MNQPLDKSNMDEQSTDRVDPANAADALLGLLNSKVPVSLALDLSRPITDSQDILMDESGGDLEVKPT